MKQNTQNRIYITMRVYKHDNKNTQFTKLNRIIENIKSYIYKYIYIYIYYIYYIYIHTMIKIEPK